MKGCEWVCAREWAFGCALARVRAFCCCRALQGVAVHCTDLVCCCEMGYEHVCFLMCSIVVCCSALQCVAVCCSVYEHVCVLMCSIVVCCSVLQFVAVCCSVLQCVAACCSVCMSMCAS